MNKTGNMTTWIRKRSNEAFTLIGAELKENVVAAFLAATH